MRFPPTPPKGSDLSVAADMHGHNFPPDRMTGNERPGGHDFQHSLLCWGLISTFDIAHKGVKLRSYGEALAVGI